MHSYRLHPFWLLGVAATAGVLEAQCALQLVGGGSLCGVQGAYRNIRSCGYWDPDGAGPSPPLLVVGGEFTQAGSADSNRIAAVNPVTGEWSTFGDGFHVLANSSYGRVNSCTTMANGDLVVGGYLDYSGSTQVGNIARWNGAAWSSLLWPVSLAVLTVCALPNGHVLAGGYGSGLLEYDGVSWTTLNAGFSGTVFSVKALANGDWIVAGEPTSGTTRIRRRVGTTWTTLGADFAGSVTSIVEMPNSDIVVGGSFASVGALSASSVARWNGTSWQAMGAGLQQGAFQAHIGSLVLRANGDVAAFGAITSSGSTPIGNVAAWNGTSWSAPAAAVANAVYGGTELPSGELVAVGSFTRIGLVDCYGIARWDGAAWQPVGNGTSSTIDALAWMPNGDLVVAGSFTRIDGVAANCIARRVGSTWVPLGGGSWGVTVTSLLTLPNGDLVVGGWFGWIDNIQVNRVARWNGTSWSALGSGMDNGVLALARLPNGDIAAAGTFSTAGGVPASRIAIWNGSTWSALGSGLGTNSTYLAGHSLLALPDGSLVVGGEFTTAGGVAASRVARWDGSTWSGYGSGLNNLVTALATNGSGNLVAGVSGSINLYPLVAEWNGSTWLDRSSNLTGSVRCFQTMPNGRWIAGGEFNLNSSSVNLASWNGSSWSSFGGGTDGMVRTMGFRPDGQLAIGGAFFKVGGVVAPFRASLTTPCPAAVVPQPTACVGPAGPMALVATHWPMLGATFRSTCSGFAASALGCSVVGFAPASLPLVQLLPVGLPNCDLVASTEILAFPSPVAGACSLQLAIPNSPLIVGVQLYHQFLQADLQIGNVTSLSGSNGLILTIGSF